MRSFFHATMLSLTVFSVTVFSVTVFSVTVFSVTVFSAVAAHGADKSQLPFEPTLSLRSRYEFFNWFEPRDPALDNNYAFAHTKLQFGVRYKGERLKAFLEGQYFQLYDLPEAGIGPGDVYYRTNGLDHSPGDVVLRQAHLTFGAPLSEGLSSEWLLGRALYANGGEVISGVKELEVIKQQRIQNRVLGPFDFTAGRSFDSGRAALHPQGLGTVSASFMRPTQGGFSTDGSAEMEINLVTATLTSDAESWPGAGEAQLFYYYYGDERDEDIVKLDNRPTEVRALDREAIRIQNFGVHWVQIYPLGDLSVNTLLWGVLQSGDWGEEDHRASAFALEVEGKLPAVLLRPALRFGYNWGSGDSNGGDSDHKTFFQMLPTARQYAMTPFFNMMNNEDLFSLLTLQLSEKLKFVSAFHYLRLQNGQDLLYSGGGAARNDDQFGFAGALLGGSEELGYLLDLSLSYVLTNYLSTNIYFGHLFGGDVPDSAYADGDINYGFIELTVKLPT